MKNKLWNWFEKLIVWMFLLVMPVGGIAYLAIRSGIVTADFVYDYILLPYALVVLAGAILIAIVNNLKK